MKKKSLILKYDTFEVVIELLSLGYVLFATLKNQVSDTFASDLNNFEKR